MAGLIGRIGRISLGVSAQVMRRNLVDHAWCHSASKRGATVCAVCQSRKPETWLCLTEMPILRRWTVSDRLEKLEMPEPARIVELRAFGGLTIEEVVNLQRAPAFNRQKRSGSPAKVWLNR